LPRRLILINWLSFLKTPHPGRFSFSGFNVAVSVLLSAVLLLLAWLQPFHSLPWVSWHSEILAFLAVVLLSWSGLLNVVKQASPTPIALPVSAFPFLALTLVAWFQAATGLLAFRGDAMVLTGYLGVCVACLTLGRAGSRDQSSYAVLAITVLLAAFGSTIVALAQTFELWESSLWINRMFTLRRAGANLGQPNQLATLILMGLGSLLFLFESRKVGSMLSVFIIIPLILGLAICESRTSLLTFGVLTIWWFAKRKSLNLRLSSWAVVLAVIGFMGLFWTVPLLLNEIQQMSGVGGEVNTAVGTRWVVWPQLVAAILQRPWWGWGLGQVATAQNASVHAYSSSESFTYCHNILLDIALGVGLPIAGLLLLVSLIWLWRRILRIKQLASWYCVALILPVAVHSMLEFPFAYAYFLVPVMLAVGMLDGQLSPRPMVKFGAKPMAGILLVATFLVMWSIVEHFAIEEDFRVVRFEALQVGKTPDSYTSPNVLLLTQLGALLTGGRIVPKPGMLEQELQLAREVALRYPWPATQNRYALSLALNGQPNEAIRQLRVMRILHGETNYGPIRRYWLNLAHEKYPQLGELNLP